MGKNELLEELSKIQEQAKKYEYRREIDEKIINKAKALKQDVQELIEMLDPASKLDKTQRKTKLEGRGEKADENRERAKELYKILQAGTQITRDLITKTYPSASDNDVFQIRQMIRKMPNVETRKDKREIILYARH